MSPPAETPSRTGPLARLRSDLPASLVVFLVALPLCLGIALASGAPLLSGLIAGIVGGVVVGLFGDSKLGVSGPAAGLAVIVLTAIQDLGSFQIFLVAVVLAGLIQLALGYARAGIIAYYFPSSVIMGMLAGIGVIITLKQIPHVFGIDQAPVGEMAYQQPDGETTLSALTHLLQSMDQGVVLVAAVALGLLILWEQPFIKRTPLLGRLPGPLLAVLAGVGIQLGLDGTSLAIAAEHMVSIPVGASLSEFFTTPDFSALTNPAVYKTAVVLAVVASLETLLSVEATDKLDPAKDITDTNRELKGQGIANLVSGLIGGLPITQVIVRSSANAQAGANSRTSAVLHGVWLIAAIALLPAVMNMIPLAALSAILIVIGYKLARPSTFVRMYREGWGHLLPFLATILGIVFTDLLIGVGIGMHVAAVVILFENYRLPFNTTTERDGDLIRIHLSQQVTFLNKAAIRKMLNDLPHGSAVELDCAATAFMHADVREIIEDFKAHAPTVGIDFKVSELCATTSPSEARQPLVPAPSQPAN